MLRRIAALYVDPVSVYSRMALVECWDQKRDARLYAGPHPIVAHPPCGPWGQLRHMCTRQPADCGPRAVEQVRAHGGVLEHPAHSTLFARCGMPKPGEAPDAHGGRTIAVEQVRWGHVARKPTWLYLVGVGSAGPMPPAREPTHWVSGDRARCRAKYGTVLPPGIRHASAEQRRRTPPAFAEWLVALARSVERDGASGHRPKVP